MAPWYFKNDGDTTGLQYSKPDSTSASRVSNYCVSMASSINDIIATPDRVEHLIEDEKVAKFINQLLKQNIQVSFEYTDSNTIIITMCYENKIRVDKFAPKKFYSAEELLYYIKEVYEDIMKEVNRGMFTVKEVIFNDPATIVYWTDGTKTVVKCDGEKFDAEKGFAMAVSKKALGNKGNYYSIFKTFLPKEED